VSVEVIRPLFHLRRPGTNPPHADRRRPARWRHARLRRPPHDSRTDLQGELRPEHRAYLRELADRGALHGSGPIADGESGALLILDAPDRAVLDALLAEDPFARTGVIAAIEVRTWNVVIGPWSAGLAG